jgi:MerR family transcriptional regulator, light-induced transcriptional regulator
VHEPVVPVDAGIAALRDDYLAALLASDGTRARHLVDRAVAGGVSVPEVYLGVLAPALEEIGRLWERGELSVAYEHFATSVTQGIVGALGPTIRVPPRGGRLAVVACAPGEAHALGAQMLGDLLEAAGWEVLLLGAATPAGDLAALVRDEQPDVVCLSSSNAALLDRAGETIALLREEGPGPFVLVGGWAWRGCSPSRVAALGADACALDAAEGVRVLVERFPPLADG